MSNIIPYRQFLRWMVDLEGVTTIEDIYSAKRRQRIRQTERIVGESDYSLKVEVLTPKLLEQFYTLYVEHIGAKDHPTLYPVKERINELWEAGRKVYIVSLYDGDTFIGGMIFRRMKHYTSVYYRVYPFSLRVKTPISPSYLGEKLLIEKTIEWGKQGIIHGKDRNAYGLNSDIGLAGFKMRQGARPQVSKATDNPILELDPSQLETDVLVFLGTELDTWITEAHLYSNTSEEELKQQFHGVFSSSHVKVTVIPRG